MSTRVLVATDGSEPSRQTQQFAVRLARALPMELVLAHVLALEKLEYKMIPDFQVEMIRQGAKRASEQLLETEAAALRSQGVEVEPRLLVGSPGPALCDLARREQVALLVTGRRGHGDLQDILFGSVSNHLVHHCPVPVLVVKTPGPAPVGHDGVRPVRALLAVDGSPASQRCVDYVASLGEWKGGLAITLVHVVNPERPGFEHLPGTTRYEAIKILFEAGERLLAGAAQRLAAAGHAVTTRVEEGSAGKTICRIYQEDQFEVVILGRRGLGELADMLFGSVCHFVVHHCPGHVLLVP
ncbi:MAG: universal stress protein [Deferrisomatales bacterium]